MSTEHSRQRDGAPLTDKLLEAIANHLNQDHSEDLLACAQASNLEWAMQARVIHLDAAGITLEASGDDKVQFVRIDFPQPAQGVLSFKRILGALIDKSRTQLGWAATNEEN